MRRRHILKRLTAAGGAVLTGGYLTTNTATAREMESETSTQASDKKENSNQTVSLTIQLR